MSRNLVVVLITVLAIFLQGTLACVSGSCSQGMCSDIPANNQVNISYNPQPFIVDIVLVLIFQYYLTSFCDSSVACGSFSGNCNEYYAADYKRFGCNSISTYPFLSL
jgi:hypothetical protein